MMTAILGRGYPTVLQRLQQVHRESRESHVQPPLFHVNPREAAELFTNEWFGTQAVLHPETIIRFPRRPQPGDHLATVFGIDVFLREYTPSELMTEAHLL